MPLVYEKNETLFFVTDKRKKVYSELKKNSRIEMASYNQDTRKWLRICGKAEVESSNQLKEDIMDAYPNLKRTYRDENEIYLVIYRLRTDEIHVM